MDTTAEADKDALDPNMTWDELERSGALHDVYRDFEAAIPAETRAVLDSFTPLTGSVGREVDGTRGFNMPGFEGKWYVIPNAPRGVDPLYFVPDPEPSTCKPGELQGVQFYLTMEQRDCLARSGMEQHIMQVEAEPQDSGSGETESTPDPVFGTHAT